jgi:predicted HTH domain antitoxin
MSLRLEISDEVVAAMRLPQQEVSAELMKELALGLYARGVLSIGKAVEMAGITRQAFEALLAQRHIVRPFDSAELETDLAWAAKGF